MQDSFYVVGVAARAWETADIVTFDLTSLAGGELPAGAAIFAAE
jgi:hypothetical protein